MEPRPERTAASATVLARPFPKDVAEQRVQALFAVYGRIIRVRLRFQQSNLQQKDSVYIEFADAAGANAAIADPPLQLGSTSNRFECMHKEDYAQQQQSFPQTSSLATSTGKRKQGSADTVADNAADLTANKEKSIKRKKLEVAQAKEIDELQAALKQEQAQNAQLKEGSKQALQEASDAKAQEKNVQNELRCRNVEICSLKGQLDATTKRSKGAADSVHAKYRPKIQDLEAQVQQLKDALETELSRNRKRTLPKFEL